MLIDVAVESVCDAGVLLCDVDVMCDVNVMIYIAVLLFCCVTMMLLIQLSVMWC